MHYLDKVFKVNNMNIQVLVVTDESLPFVVVLEIVVVENCDIRRNNVVNIHILSVFLFEFYHCLIHQYNWATKHPTTVKASSHVITTT